jgi:hypothetical protein
MVVTPRDRLASQHDTGGPVNLRAHKHRTLHWMQRKPRVNSKFIPVRRYGWGRPKSEYLGVREFVVFVHPDPWFDINR